MQWRRKRETQAPRPTLTFWEAVKQFHEWDTDLTTADMPEEDKNEAKNLNRIEFTKLVADLICNTYKH